MLVGLAAAALLAGCGSPTQGITFHAPAGYVSAVSFGPFMQAWSGPRHQTLLLMVLPRQISLNETLANSTLQDVDVKTKKRIAICGDQPAIYASMVGTPSHGGTPGAGHERLDRIEFVATNLSGKTYMAMYLRPIAAAADPLVHDAILHICPSSATND